MPTRVLALLDKTETVPAGRGVVGSVHFFGCSAHVADDFENHLRAAVAEWLATPAGQAVRAQIDDARFDWGYAIDWVPPELWQKHGLVLRPKFFNSAETLALDYQPVM